MKSGSTKRLYFIIFIFFIMFVASALPGIVAAPDFRVDVRYYRPGNK